MTVVVTNNVAGRFRGFLASCMLEIAPGVYTGPSMAAGVRDRIWLVLESWHQIFPEGAIVMTWVDAKEPGKQGVKTLGWPPRELVRVQGIWLSRQALPTAGPLSP
jgi:CRISPR-associated protein Cas2